MTLEQGKKKGKKAEQVMKKRKRKHEMERELANILKQIHF